MRMRCYAAAAAVLALAALDTGRAAAQPATAGEPTIEVRLRSVNDLLDRVEYVAGLFGQEEPAKQFRGLVRQLSGDATGIEGIDPKRPFGLYATITPDVADSPVVLMVPIADQQRLLQALKDRLGIEPQKAAGGGYKAEIPVPFLAEPIHFRFEHDYLYVSPREQAVDPKAVVSPKAFFAKDDGSAVSVLVRIDRIPADVKGFALSQFEMGVNQGRKKAGADPAQQKVEALVADAIVGGTKTLFDDGKDLSVKLFVDAKADELAAEVTLTAKDGSTLAKNFAALADRTSLPAGIVASKSPVGQAAVKVGMTDDLRKRFAAALDDLLTEATKQAKAEERGLIGRVVTAVAPTLKAGELDAAVSLTGPDAKGRYGLLAAVTVKDGKGIEKLARDFAPMIPADAAEVTFDVAKAGRFGIHKVELKQADPEFERVFGGRTVWVAVADDCLVVSIEPDGAVIRQAVTAAPAKAAVLTAEVSLAKVIALARPDLKPDELKAILKDAFGEGPPAGRDAIAVSVEGGKQLTARVKVKGQALRLAASLEQFKVR
jgi:hypothetical protein